MIPTTVRFTGLTLNPLDLLYGYGGRKANFTPPAHWVRVEFASDHSVERGLVRGLERVDSWIASNTAGKWVSHESRYGSTIVVLFEDDNDALLFKLMGGETAWKEQEAQSN